MFHCLEKSNWLSSNVMFPSINVVINTACEIGKVSSKWTAGFNLPFRVMNMIAHRRANYQMVLEVAALAALFFPCGRYIAIAIDTISVGVSWYHDHTPTPGLSPTTRDIEVSDEQYLAKWVRLQARIHIVAERLIYNRDQNAVRTIEGDCVKTGGKLLMVGLKKLSEIGAREVATETAVGLSKEVIEEIVKETVEAVGQEYVKQIPVFGFAVGTMLAIYRFSQGQFWRGVGEIASGATSCVPGYGTIISIGLDVVLMGQDIREAMYRPSLRDARRYPMIALMPLDVPGAYQILGIDPKTKPDQPRVKEAFCHLRMFVHSSGLQQRLVPEGLSSRETEEARKSLQECIEALEKVRGVLETHFSCSFGI